MFNLSHQQILFVILSSVIAILASCNKEIDTEWEGLNYPSHFSPPVQKVIAGRRFSQEGFNLGKKLFYDPILSRDSSISCGSCHKQPNAFSHAGQSISLGIEQRLGLRNAPALQNLIWQPTYFHDGGVFNIDLISLAPIENPLEMDENISQIIIKLNKHKEYPALFEHYFGTKEITTGRILTAITQFQARLISANSRYDQYLLGKIELSYEEKEGKQLFEHKCSRCHAGIQFSDFAFRNNGIPLDLEKDPGRYRISIVESDKGKFKTPSLRNIELTYPYMHDGSIHSLEEVLEHYNSGIQHTIYLDSSLQAGIPMSKLEQQKIISFLKTLTDRDFITNPLFKEE